MTQIRGWDNWGAGFFHAPRGARLHNGVDIISEPGEPVKCINKGKVTKLGFAYEDDLSFRYVQITDSEGTHWRYFYVDPCVAKGDEVEAYTVIGETQSLLERYPGIQNHYHFEIIKDGEYIDPTGFVKDM